MNNSQILENKISAGDCEINIANHFVKVTFFLLNSPDALLNSLLLFIDLTSKGLLNYDENQRTTVFNFGVFGTYKDLWTTYEV